MPFTLRPYRRFPVQCAVTYNARPFLYLPLTYLLSLGSLITLLLLSSGPAYGEWVLVSGDDEAGLTVYVDPDTIRRKGDLVKLWVLYDYKTVQTVVDISYLSRRSQTQFDCAEERERLLVITLFPNNMGNSNVAFNDSREDKWTPVAPRTVGQVLWAFACGKK